MNADIDVSRYTGFERDSFHGAKHGDIVFVYGALRSGTTVFRLMLDGHPRISNPGEMDFLFDYLATDPTHDTGWRYDMEALSLSRIFLESGLEIEEGLMGLDMLDSFFDQLKSRAPGQVLSINLHRNINKVWQILPLTRVLHMLRDPRDVARSSIQMGWAGTLYHGVEHWIGTETAWGDASKQVDPTQILEISYEGLFRDIDTALHSVCDFFQLPFEPSMLTYHETSTYSPPDPSLIEQWKRKCAPAELEEVETHASDLMQERGYIQSQPETALSSVRLAKLAIRNKLYIWKFGMGRHGAIVYWAAKVTRLMGFRSAYHYFKLRMNETAAQHTK